MGWHDPPSAELALGAVTVPSKFMSWRHLRSIFAAMSLMAVFPKYDPEKEHKPNVRYIYSITDFTLQAKGL